MRIKKVTIEGFRGAPKRFELALDGKSLCLLGENGLGKTTIVDALEYWSTGAMPGFSRERCKIDAAINLDHGGPATISCERKGYPTLIRSLRDTRAEPLETVGGEPADSLEMGRLPILRHSTMASFMTQTSGNKKRELLEFLGLEDLIEFRDTLVAAANKIREQADQAGEWAQKEREKLDDECGNKPLMDHAEDLRRQAGLQDSLTSEEDLLKLDLTGKPAIAARVSRAELLEDVLSRSAQLKSTAIDEWNHAIADERAKQAEAVHQLLEAGRKVLGTWDQDTCPLCQRPSDRAELDTALADRAVELAELDASIKRARVELTSHKARARELTSKMTELLKTPPADGWPASTELQEIAESLATHSEQVRTALTDTSVCPVLPAGSDLGPRADALRAAVGASESPAMTALTELGRLRLLVEQRNKADAKSTASEVSAEGIAALRDLAEGRIKSTVEGAIARLGQTAADFYGQLVRNPVYTDVELEYTDRRSGGIEFKLMFNGRHPVSPPQRVVSESQLNALGLAFFFARLKVENTEWRTIVLDDVVNSFDADHRMGLARLLAEEFSDWQVLLFTHDSSFTLLAEQILKGWRFWQIVAWSAAGGPVLGDADPLRRLKARLDAGETALDLGGLARVALERSLSRPLERLGLPIRHDPRSRFSSSEYLDALQDGFTDRGSSLKDLTVLKRMKAQSYLTNIGAHDRPANPTLSTADLRQMADDLDELTVGLICQDCAKPVWEIHKDLRHSQCECGKLTV